MVKKKRIYKSILGIPIWVIITLSAFMLIQALYDFCVGDRSVSRYVVIISALIILTISLLLNLTKVETLKRILKNQVGY